MTQDQDPVICPACEIAVSGDYQDKARFYDADPERKFSPEADYGNFWTEREGARFPLWRVTYNGRGDVFAMELGGSGRIRQLGYFEPDPGVMPGRDKWYVGLDDALRDWAEESGRPLSWVQDRIGFGHNRFPGVCSETPEGLARRHFTRTVRWCVDCQQAEGDVESHGVTVITVWSSDCENIDHSEGVED